MNNFYINPLSVNEQCHTSNDVLDLMIALVECFKYLQPAIKKERIKLLYDSSIESRQFICHEFFEASISKLPKEEHDVKTLWFRYTRNNAEDVLQNPVQTTVSSAHCPELVEGDISGNSLLQDAHWISFGKHLLNEAKVYNVSQNGNTPFTVKNAYHQASLKQLLPSYEPSNKHRKESYFDSTRGEQVAAMPLDTKQAQELLLISVEDRNDRIAYHQGSKKFYRFKLTHTDKNIYHGFQIERDEISEEMANNCMA
ncbi:hypothetical protein ACH5Y9_08030 [Methylomonas sp. BW4-1]|uniref:hypothetical protein n=1 Tax=Methylomonas sp. BW4-1 TaxID=3376685 RepID=UPI004041B297